MSHTHHPQWHEQDPPTTNSPGRQAFEGCVTA
jgi:hypothetical protein